MTFLIELIKKVVTAIMLSLTKSFIEEIFETATA